MNPIGQNQKEMILNGILDEEVEKYFHICFFTDDHGPDLENPDSYIFIPKPICRIVDDRTISIHEWYVQKKDLSKYVRGRRRSVDGSINQERLRKVLASRKAMFRKL